MELTDAVASTLGELNKQFESLQGQFQGLQRENASLKEQLNINGTNGSNSMQLHERPHPQPMDRPMKLPGEPDLIGDIEVQSATAACEGLRVPQRNSQVSGIPCEHISSLRSLMSFNEPLGDLTRRASVKRVDPETVNQMFLDGGMSAFKGTLRGDRNCEDKPGKQKSTPEFEDDNLNLAERRLMAIRQGVNHDDSMTRQPMTFEEFIAALSGKKHGGNCIERFASSLLFHGLAMGAILGNTLYLGIAAHLDVTDSFKVVQGQPMEGPLVAVDYSFVGWFTVEILIRIIAHKKEFVFGDDWKWNLFDCVLVLESLLSLFLPTGGKLACLRVFRVFRMVRIVRLVRSVKALTKLRTMVFAFINTFIDLLWAVLVIFVIIFVFSVFFANMVAAYFQSVNPSSALEVADAEKINENFGGMMSTMLSLWAAVSGGNDWMFYAEQLELLGSFSLPFFIFYIAFCATGMWNVVTGVFVDSAVCSRTEDEVAQGYLDEYNASQAQIRSFFCEVDEEGFGTVSREVFLRCLKRPHVKAYLSGMDIDPEEGPIIFSILDRDKSGGIDIKEFTNGILKLKGGATKLDFMAMMYDSTMQNLKFDNLVDFVEREISVIKSLIANKGWVPSDMS